MAHPSFFRRGLRQFRAAILDSICPPLCAGCGEGLDLSTPLCPRCRAGLQVRTGPSVCLRCGTPGRFPGAPCQVDHRPLRGIDMARAPFRYAGTAGALVRRMKFQRDLSSGAYLAQHMAAALSLWSRYEGRRARLVSVPLHRSKRRKRGFDQAGWLAERVAFQLGLTFVPNALSRVRNTLPQGDPRVTNRQANVDGAFVVRRRSAVEGAIAVLVDDVMTSGTTARECAAVLRAAGAKRVVLLTAARA